MKKKLYILCIMILFICSGCSNAEDVEINIEEIYDTDEHYLAQPYWWEDNIKKVDSGYYFINSNRLYYWDSETKSGTIVCSASNCEHNNPQCNAYLGSFGENYDYGFMNLDLEIYNNHIYKIGYKLDEVTDFYVYSISLDGSEREQMGYLYSKESDVGGGITMTYDWIMIDGYYYGAYSSDNEPYGLYKIRVDGEKTLLYDMSDKLNATVAQVQGIGNNICFTMSWLEEQGTSSYKNAFMCYNTETEEMETLLEDSVMCEYCFYDENHIFYNDVTGRCYLLNLDTGENGCILGEDSATGVLSSDGKYLYIKEEDYLYVYDENGVSIDTIYIDYSNVLYGDEDYLFLTSPVEPGQPYEKVNGQTTSLYMWILDKSQIGIEDKQWMKMDLETY